MIERAVTNNTQIPQAYYDDDGLHVVQPGDSVTLRHETHTNVDGGMPRGYTGETYRYLRLDPSGFALKTIGHGDTEVHEGHAFSVHNYEITFDKASEIGILFTAPNTSKRLHCLFSVYCGAASVFDVCEAPTLDTGNYPTTFYAPINADRNSSNTSGVLSMRGMPVVNQASLKLKANTTPITGDGTVIHVEMLGSGKQGGGSGRRSEDEIILKPNTTYYFRLKGSTNGADSAAASMQISWYEHTDLE